MANGMPTDTFARAFCRVYQGTFCELGEQPSISGLRAVRKNGGSIQIMYGEGSQTLLVRIDHSIYNPQKYSKYLAQRLGLQRRSW